MKTIMYQCQCAITIYNSKYYYTTVLRLSKRRTTVKDTYQEVDNVWLLITKLSALVF